MVQALTLSRPVSPPPPPIISRETPATRQPGGVSEPVASRNEDHTVWLVLAMVSMLLVACFAVGSGRLLVFAKWFSQSCVVSGGQPFKPLEDLAVKVNVEPVDSNSPPKPQLTRAPFSIFARARKMTNARSSPAPSAPLHLLCTSAPPLHLLCTSAPLCFSAASPASPATYEPRG